MIQPANLRLGNLLLSAGKPCSVSSITADEVGVKPLDGGGEELFTPGELDYLPLSEEWMHILAGDETGYISISGAQRTSDSSDIIILSTVECYLHDDGFLRVCAYEYEKHPDESVDISDDVITLGYDHIRQVHQLQNLYFNLTSKELPVQAG